MNLLYSTLTKSIICKLLSFEFENKCSVLLPLKFPFLVFSQLTEFVYKSSNRAIYIPGKVRSDLATDNHKSNGMVRNPCEVSMNNNQSKIKLTKFTGKYFQFTETPAEKFFRKF